MHWKATKVPQSLYMWQGFERRNGASPNTDRRALLSHTPGSYHGGAEKSEERRASNSTAKEALRWKFVQMNGESGFEEEGPGVAMAQRARRHVSERGASLELVAVGGEARGSSSRVGRLAHSAAS
ncbi:hypothetical protein AAFF_G00341840 [Aldrovandia affinis]|uniref:Uncharacterized protein n=1 Tax=Aldrovandia affinis TaxID=143900 RepID=A0AAD7WPA6_9TELE|nr:hypothetical protein AAFF_G00341840 [Aldrovandia affinis]